MNERFRPNSEAAREIESRTLSLVREAKEDAIVRTNLSPDAIRRVENAIEGPFKDYVKENETISYQITTPEYNKHVYETAQFLEARVAAIACPDGRIISFSFADPRAMSVARRLGGIPKTRISTRTHQPILNDPEITASLATDISRRKRAGEEEPEIIEFVGPHIHSEDPEEGCGDRKGRIAAKGKTFELGMKDGGIGEYYEELGDQFNAFDNLITSLGGRPTTFDFIHDAYSQGFIVGLKDAVSQFDQDKSLRYNIEELVEKHQVLATEFLDSNYRNTITDLAMRMAGVDHLDVERPDKMAENTIIMGEIARELTQREEANNYDFIPEPIRDGKSIKALRALTYTAFRNVAYRVLGRIRPGQHNLLKHPERLLRIGPTGADFNIQNIPFIQFTSFGNIEEDDLSSLATLYNLSYGIARERGVNLQNEGRIILTTGEFNGNAYVSEETREAEFHKVTSFVGNNAAAIRDMFRESVYTGETIVVGNIHNPTTRKLSHIAR